LLLLLLCLTSDRFRAAYVFDEVSVDNSVLDFGVYYNYTISRGRDIVGAMSLITQAFASLLPSPQIVANFRTSPLCGA
jgi:hypothetical protein